MHKLSKKKRDNRKKAFGSKKEKSPSPHIFSNERWIVTVVGSERRPTCLLSEEKAEILAAKLATESGLDVEIDHQTFNGTEWVS